MSDDSIWKKEISFKRKATEEQPEEKTTTGDEPTSVWKKEISLKRKPKAAEPEVEVEVEKDAVWQEQIEKAADQIRQSVQPTPEPVQAEHVPEDLSRCQTPSLVPRRGCGRRRSASRASRLRRLKQRPRHGRSSSPFPPSPSRRDLSRCQTPSLVPRRRCGRRRSASRASRLRRLKQRPRHGRSSSPFPPSPSRRDLSRCQTPSLVPKRRCGRRRSASRPRRRRRLRLRLNRNPKFSR